ncbi:hypothetical protein KY342_04780 [Candidatus Woesearchaeota archaeon]|nr:hypothetical protein [Candidatus Woesearchaeota archaeon]
MKITICSSSSFFQRIKDIKEGLEKTGHEVLLPSMQEFPRQEDVWAKIQYDLIKDHFRKIDQSHAIYIANFDKNGIEGYIGGNSFLEMGKAFDKGIPIFLLNDIPQQNYTDEIIAMKPVVVGSDWAKLNKYLIEFYKSNN